MKFILSYATLMSDTYIREQAELKTRKIIIKSLEADEWYLRHVFEAFLCCVTFGSDVTEYLSHEFKDLNDREF